MKKVILNDKNNIYSYKELQDAEATQSKIFKANGLIYKMLNEKDEKILEIKEKKLELFDKFDEPYLLDLDSKIVDENDVFRGFSSKYIKGESLLNYKDKLDLLVTKNILLNISEDLERFHKLKGRPVIGDLHFNNILIDKDYKHHFLDIDSYGINHFKAENVPYTYYNYCALMNYDIKKNQNADRVKFFLSLFTLFFGKSLLRIDEKTFDNKASEYEFLKDIKDLFLDLKSSHSEIIEVPYIHELVKKL